MTRISQLIRVSIFFLLVIAISQIAYAKAVDDVGNKSGFPNEVNITPTLSLQQDSLALVVLYDSTNGANWTNNTNWKTGNSLSTWYGITVTDGRVTSVNLHGNNLVGTIPSTIGNMDSLQYLNFGYNQLIGSIPLTNLLHLKKYHSIETSTYVTSIFSWHYNICFSMISTILLL